MQRNGGALKCQGGICLRGQKAATDLNLLQGDPVQHSGLPTHPGSPLPGLSIPRIQSLKTPMAAGLHGPCVLQCVGFATGRGDAEQEKSCNSDMNSQHFGIFARGSCRSRHGGQFGSLRSKVALTSMGAPRQSTISTIAHRRACCISDMQGLHVEERDSSLFKGTKPSGSSPAGSHTEISLLNS
ncbi:uncharacterized protein LOC125720556 isoform X5 [Brienomyrus brachyistius]|uniref:uncharacterized protein LOC125720556 isoform X5 n=1 Tax=Brienomyrus brachyistius TaxID=42636 RepID=UPI0020B1C322|nr:uncharacterized protein LOC125720556 isoform X5 [Brienomyrus brachyistius]XP_048852104.1 uncharacterized protein LOC125720556 isoform X5 [Brienomyrus brachyistius]